MNYKKIVSLALTILIMSPVTAFAKGNENSQGKNSKTVQTDKQQAGGKQKVTPDMEADNKPQQTVDAQSKGQENKAKAEQKRYDKKQQIAAFKAAMKEKHTVMKGIKQQLAAVRSEAEQKKSHLESIVAELQAGTKTLPKDMLDQLMAASQNLQLDVKDVKDTAEVKNEISETQDKVEKSDFNNALASMDKVITKLHARLTALILLSSDLDTALKIANLATIPTTTPDSTPIPAATLEPTGNPSSEIPDSSGISADSGSANDGTILQPEAN